MGEPVRTIHDLDTKSLQHIFSYLSLVDKLKLALIHHNAIDLIKDALHNETFDAFDIQITFSALEAECILACYGDFIRKYRHVSTCEDENSIGFLRLIPEYCQNLEEIVLSGRELKPNDVYSRLLSVSKHVKALTLRKCILGNASCSLLSGLSKLEVLNLEDSKLTGKDLNKLRNLMDLNLKNCRNFKARNFIEICKSNKLKKLNIVGLKQLTHACIQTLLDTQADIQILIVGNKYWFKDPSRIFQLKNLREVSMISCYEPIAATYLKTLADEQKESLECLEVNFGNSYPENDGDFLETNIISRICEFGNLKVLSLRNSALLEDQHLVRIAKMCKHLEMLDIHGTGFRDIGIISSVEHLERLRYLDISYCTVKRTLYCRLLATRQEQGSSQQLVVYIKPKMELESLLISDEYKSYQRFVKLVVAPMRLNNEISILERLQQLNTTHPQKHQYRELRRRRLNNRFETLHQKVSLLSLDENSLHHIIQYLDLSEKLTLILINEHFCSVVKHFLHKDFVVFVEIISNFTVNEARKILSRCGSMMKRLYIQNPVYHLDTEYYDLIAEFCVNLEELLCEDLIGVSSLASIIRASSGTLEILGLYRCEAYESVEMEIARASNLKKLSLIGNDYVGSHISQLRKLVDLDLAWCEKFRPEHFITICRNNRLEKLAIRGCTALNNEAFSVLSETQHHLQKLKLGGIYVASNIFTIANLPNIIDIRVTDIAAQEIIQCLNALINHRAADVQCLGIQCLDEPKITMLPTLRNSILEFRNLKFIWLSCSTFVNDAYLRQIVKSCPLLEALDLSFIYDLTNDGILYAIKHLKHLQHLNVKECRQLDDILTLYQEVLKIKVQQVDAQSLVLYLDLPCDGLKETKEYAVMKKYVTILKDRFRPLPL
ncbi:uncharacterized protein LOC119650395 isoform X5 [Hermetia illucens]|uniref:uncharacterized protein LOC119650395 isoform X5 n=1 Tax=Hermetia illucens TaxID=343691 RepID=UPI0018CC6486|nr:uncharacterized protein LOC119650395 isoform X5 [Hermetia illucens]